MATQDTDETRDELNKTVTAATRRNDGRAYTPLKEYDSTQGKNFLRLAARIFADYFYPVYNWLLGGRQFVDDFEHKLSEANIRTTADLYISGTLGFGTLLGAIFGILTGLVYYTLTNTLASIPVLTPTVLSTLPESYITSLQPIFAPMFIFGLGLLGSMVGLILSAVFVLPYPYLRAMGREREINILLPDAIGYMYALSVGGMNQLKIIESVADADDAYGEVSVEFKRAMQQSEYFNVDYRTSLRNVASTTPSDPLHDFLIDMLSRINSGGDMTLYLEEQKDKFADEVARQQKDDLKTLEFFSEMYMPISIIPIVILIITAVMSMMSTIPKLPMSAIVYVGIPAINALYLVVISTIKQDDPGHGYLNYEGSKNEEIIRGDNLLSLDIVNKYVGEGELFRNIRQWERVYNIGYSIKNAPEYFRRNPSHTFAFTVPLTALVLLPLIISGSLELSQAAFFEHPLKQTAGLFYLPAFLMLIPFTLFYEWSARTRLSIVDTLTDDLRALASNNETGMPLVEAMKVTADHSDSRLSDEFMTSYKKVSFGRSLKDSLVEFNNNYHIPRLARVVKLISKAQETSSNITEVLQTAAQTSETQDEIRRERVSRTRMQIAVIGVTYVVFLGVLALLFYMFTTQMSRIGGSAATESSQLSMSVIDTSFVGLIYFHATTIHGVCAGVISGYMQTTKLSSGAKYAVIYLALSLAVWSGVYTLI